MTATVIEIPRSIFNFSGQMHLDTFSIPFEKVAIDFDSYDDLAINGLRMAMKAIASVPTISPTGSRGGRSADRPMRTGSCSSQSWSSS
jgi:hypothetical protein